MMEGVENGIFMIKFFMKTRKEMAIFFMVTSLYIFLDAPKHLYNWLCPSVGWLGVSAFI